jgi:hypothetical protein
MNHTQDDSNWQFAPGSLDIGPEEDDVLDYSKLLKRGSNSKVTAEAPRRPELRRPLSRLLAGRLR